MYRISAESLEFYRRYYTWDFYPDSVIEAEHTRIMVQELC